MEADDTKAARAGALGSSTSAGITKMADHPHLNDDERHAIGTLALGAAHEWHYTCTALAQLGADQADEREKHLRALDVLRMILSLFAAVEEGAVTMSEMDDRVGQVDDILRQGRRDALLRWTQQRRGFDALDVDALDAEIDDLCGKAGLHLTATVREAR